MSICIRLYTDKFKDTKQKPNTHAITKHKQKYTHMAHTQKPSLM